MTGEIDTILDRYEANLAEEEVRRRELREERTKRAQAIEVRLSVCMRDFVLPAVEKARNRLIARGYAASLESSCERSLDTGETFYRSVFLFVDSKKSMEELKLPADMESQLLIVPHPHIEAIKVSMLIQNRKPPEFRMFRPEEMSGARAEEMVSSFIARAFAVGREQ